MRHGRQNINITAGWTKTTLSMQSLLPGLLVVMNVVGMVGLGTCCFLSNCLIYSWYAKVTSCSVIDIVDYFCQFVVDVDETILTDQWICESWPVVSLPVWMGGQWSCLIGWVTFST